MPGLQDIPGNHTVRQYVPGQATAGTPDTFPIFVAPGKITVTGVRWVPAANVTGAATNNFALAVQNRGQDGSGTTAVTTTKTYDNGVNGVAHDSENFTLSATAANLNAVANDVISLIRTVNGTGLAMPDGAVEVDFRYNGVS
jgi:hypothetical protein